MKWLEEIRLRTQPRKEKEVMEALLEIADSIQDKKGLKSAVAYLHQAQPGGFSLILDWDTANVPMRGSETATLILEGLKPFGLLDRTVMVERRKTQQGFLTPCWRTRRWKKDVI